MMTIQRQRLSRGHALFVALAGVLVMTTGDPLVAQAQDDAALAQARQQFAEGVEAMEARRFGQAVERFRQVRQVRTSAAVDYNLALALGELGQVVEARDLLRGVIADRQAPRDMVRMSRRALPPLERRVGRLTIRVEGDAPGAALFLDEEELDASDATAPVDVDPGAHTVALRRGSTELARRSVDVGAGGDAEVTLVPTVASPEVAARTVTDGDAAGTSNGGPLVDDGDDGEGSGGVLSQWWFWTIVVVAVAGATVAVFALSSPGSEDPVHGNLDPPFLEVRP